MTSMNRLVENWTTSEDLAINGTHYGYYDGLGVYEATFTNTTFTYEYLTPADTYYGSFDVLFYDNDEGFVLLRCTDNNDPEEIGKFQKILWTENSGSYTVSNTETSFDGIHITKTDDFMIEDASVFPTQAEAEALAP